MQLSEYSRECVPGDGEFIPNRGNANQPGAPSILLPAPASTRPRPDTLKNNRCGSLAESAVRILAVLLLTSAAGMWSAPVIAQSAGAIVGRVNDSTGAVVPGASVSAINTGTGIGRNAVTNAAGAYALAQLPPSTYDLKVQLTGFADAERKGIVLNTASTLTVDITLGLAGVNEAVQVTGDAPLVEKSRSEVSSTLRLAEVQNLPMLNRDFTGLVTLVPGARPAPVLDTTKANMGAGIAVSGNEGRNLGLNIDGAENRDNLLGGAALAYTVESIQEFKLLAHQFGAQYSRSSGGVVELSTKSGTNQIHGSAFGYGRNDAMTAIDYFTQQSGLPKNAYDREQFGGSLGGPIIRDQWFLFSAVERVQQNFVETEPLAAYDEMLTLANALPAMGFKPARTIDKPFRNTLYMTRTDAQLSPAHSLFVRWAQQVDSAENDQIGVSQFLVGQLPHPDLSVPNTDKHNNWSIVASDNWVISTSVLNQLVFQRNHYTAQVLGPSNVNPLRAISFPSITTGGWQGINADFVQDKYQVKDNYVSQAGNHALKFGGEVSWFTKFNIGADVLNPTWTIFSDDPSTIAGNKNGRYPQGFLTPGAAFLMFRGNLPGGDGTTAPPLADGSPVGLKQMGVYAQDDWRLSPRVTLNIGLRYDITVNGFNQREAANGRIYQALKAIESPYGALPSTPTRDFQPRAGLAWDVRGDGKDVLRGGFGVFRDDMMLADIWLATPFMKPTMPLRLTYINLPFLPESLNPLANYVYGVSPLPPGPPPLSASTALPAGAGTTGYILDPDATDPYTIQYHVGLAHQLAANTVVSADYTHIDGRHEYRVRDINPIEGPWDPAAAASTYGTRRLAPRLQAVLGDGNLLGNVKLVTTANKSQYDELIVRLEQRRRRVTLQASYTLSRGYAYGGITSGLAIAGTSVPEPENTDQFFGPGEWGPTNTDERHRVVFSGVFELPAGIQVSPVLQAASARAYSLGAGFDTNGDSVQSLGTSLGDHYIDPSGHTVGVNSERGQPSFVLDARVTKFFVFGRGSRRLGLFAEVYNLTDRTNFGAAYAGNALSTSFKQPIGYFSGLPTSRQLQLGARFTF
jgi:hypothetical protein